MDGSPGITLEDSLVTLSIHVVLNVGLLGSKVDERLNDEMLVAMVSKLIAVVTKMVAMVLERKKQETT